MESPTPETAVPLMIGRYLDRRLVTGCLVVCLVLSGCAKPGTTEDPNNGDVQSDDSPVGSPAKRDETTGVSVDRVPLAQTPLPVDDPSQQGWQTESVSAKISARLKYLDSLIASGAVQLPSGQLEIAENYHGTQLRPDDLTEVFQDSVFRIRRWEPNEELPADKFRGEEGFRDSLRALTSDVDGIGDVRTKIKVFGVRAEGDRAETDVYFQLHVDSARGVLQVSATWTCGWQQIHDAKPQLSSIRLRAYEEAFATSPGSTGFVDRTASVLNDATFADQLAHGVDHWLTRIESSQGIDVGGWQGMAIADVNGDGLDDVYLCQPGGLPNRLYVQNADGTAKETSAEAGVDWLESSHAALLVDLDNDVDQDLIVGVDNGLLVMSNDGRGRFSLRASMLLPAALPYSLAAADIDVDGDLDFYVCCYNRRRGINRHLLFARPVPYHDANNGGRNVMFRNVSTPGSGHWRFGYATGVTGLDQNNRRFSYAAAWEDYDNDGDLDLYVANDFGRNNLYQNDGGRFTDIAEAAGVLDIGPGMSACWSDYNHDGFVDLYVSNMFSSAGNRITGQEQFQQDADVQTRSAFRRHARGNSLFMNLGDGTFRDVGQEAGVVLGRWAWGSKFADLNNDGWQDLLVANGFITQADTDDL